MKDMTLKEVQAMIKKLQSDRIMCYKEIEKYQSKADMLDKFTKALYHIEELMVKDIQNTGENGQECESTETCEKCSQKCYPVEKLVFTCEC